MSEVHESVLYLVFCLLMITNNTNTKSGYNYHHPLCNELTNKTKGIIQTPGFPKQFPVPIRCKWVIDASKYQDKNIVVYLTQLYVTTGLNFTDFMVFEQGLSYGQQLGHTVTPENVTSSPWIRSFAPYLVIEFVLDRLEGNHLRFLDDKHNVYFMYGFNITYELIGTDEPVRDSCNARICSLLGDCYASADFTSYECSCFHGFSGPNCAQGPLCEKHTCDNGGTCVHSSAVSFGCKCPKGFAGSKCEIPVKLDCDGQDCNRTQCPYNGTTGLSCDCDHPQNIPMDRARYEGVIRLANSSQPRESLQLVGHRAKSLESHLERLIRNYLRNAGISKIEDLRILNITSGAEVTFHFFGEKSDGGRVRESLNRLVERGRLGELNISSTHVAVKQEPTLLIKSVSVSKNPVQVGEYFQVSCEAKGSIYMTFTWSKDGVYMNETKAKVRRSVTTHLIDHNHGLYSYTLSVHHAHPLDEGIYTCHVTDWGVQQCKAVQLSIASPPEIRLTPMSATVEKGANLDVVCIPLNNRPKQEKFGYVWGKNQHLLKMDPGKEVWEDLYLSHYNGVVYTGSVLEITDIQKSATYTCKVQGNGPLTQLSIHVDVVNKSVVPLCPAEGKYGVAWQTTSSGLETVADCPSHSGGLARRLCLQIDANTTRWQLPDFTGCLSPEIELIYNNFTRLTLGYEVTNGTVTLNKLLAEVLKRNSYLPGECERILDVLTEVQQYLNQSFFMSDFAASARAFYSVVNVLLGHEHSIIKEKQVVQIQNLVKQESMIWGSLLSSSNSAHLYMNWLIVDVTSLDSLQIYNLQFPLKSTSYPAWFADRLDIHVEATNPEIFGNGSFTVLIASYRNLSQFLPVRYVTKLNDGTDLEFEINSRLLTVELGRSRYKINPLEGSYWIDIEFDHFIKDVNNDLWNWTCAVTDAASFVGNWDLTSCTGTLVSGNQTKCHCTKTGTYAVLLVSRTHMASSNGSENSHLTVVIGCGCCLIQSLLTLCLLLPYWCRHKTCLVFLKMQCCLATAGAMSIFIYSVQHSVPKTVFPLITTLLEVFLLIGLSSHLSKLLIVYTEVIQLPAVRHMKQTVVCIMTGAPVLAVLCNLLGHHSTGWKLQSWWVMNGSMVFNVFISCAVVMVILFIFLYFSVIRKLYMLSSRNDDKNKAILRRLGLLKRGGAIFLSMILMESASIFYINVLDISSQYLFGSTSALLGFVILFCYILKSEAPFHAKLLKKLKMDPTTPDDDFSSESVISPLSFFTKQDGDAESEGAAPRRASVVPIRGRELRSSISNSVDVSEQLLMSETRGAGGDEGRSSTLETYVYSGEGSLEDRQPEQKPNSPGRYKPMTSFKFHDKGFSDYVEQDTGPEEQWRFEKSNGVLPKPDVAQCYIRETPVTSQEIITTRVCVELGVITTHQRNEVTGQEMDTPAIVLCSVDVEPCQSRVVEMSEVLADPICCNGVSNTGSFVLGITGQETEGIVCSDPDGKETSPEESKTEEDGSNSEKTDSSSVPEQDTERKQPDGHDVKDVKNVSQKQDDHMEGMLDRISHDLDYLLNRKSNQASRKTSKPPSNSVRGKIREEEEEDVKTEFLSQC